MQSKVFIFFLFFISFLPLRGQEDAAVPLVYQSTMIGIGSSSVYDTYLSRIEYKGLAVALLHEQMKMTGLMGGNVSAQHLFNVRLSKGDNEAETAEDYSGFLSYGYGLHYRFEPVNRMQLFAGAQANGLLGFVYNSRNGNNPATGKLHAGLSLSGIASYHFNIQSQLIHLRYQLNIPFAGAMFSQNYGQSYYEIGLGNDDNLAHFSSFHNYLAMQNIVSAELPVGRFTFRLAYEYWHYETKVSNLDTRISNHLFLIGLSKNFYTVPAKKRSRALYNTVFE